MEGTIAQKRYLNDPRTNGEVVVTELISGEKPIVRLAETWFHPQGGGQKPDRGLIGPAHVLHVAHNGGTVDHVVDSLDGLRVGNTYPFSIDADWRRLNAVYHTTGHLIASVVESLRPEWIAISGHQWPGEARVEFVVRENAAPKDFPTNDEILAALAASISGGLDVQIVGDPYHDRKIAIGGFQAIPCGGTHVANLTEIADVRLTGMKKKGDRFRVSYEAIPG